MNQSVSFGERLRDERLRLGLTQTAFGEIAGVTKKTQMLYESGERTPDMRYLAAVSKVGVDYSYVLTGQRLPRDLLTTGALAELRLPPNTFTTGALAELRLPPDTFRTVMADLRPAPGTVPATTPPLIPPPAPALSADEAELLSDYRESHPVVRRSIKTLLREAVSSSGGGVATPPRRRKRA